LSPLPRKPDKEFNLSGIQVSRQSFKHGMFYTQLSGIYSYLKESWPEDAKEPRIKVKHVSVTPIEGSPDEIGTRTNFQFLVESSKFSVQQTGVWHCRWKKSVSENAVPTLLAVVPESLEEVRANHEGRGPALTDVTVPILGDLPAFRESLNHGANHWITRLPLLKHRFQHGIAIGDIDNDGLEDIYLCQPERLPNLLLSRQPDGSVREIAGEYGLDFLDNTTSAIFADLDNDGDQDLAVAFRSPFAIFENVGGSFQRRFSLPHLGQIFSLSVADPDKDGRLDIFVCRYQNFDELGRARSAVPLHDANNGGNNAFLKNLGRWKFVDATEEVGFNHNNHRWSVASSWEDYDRDGDLDLYIANDYGRDNLYRCDTAADGTVRFSDIAASAGVEDMTTSMGVTWGDPNRDGRPDAYVSNMYSSAGQRVTFQKNFKRNIAGADAAHVKAWQNAAMGNSLFQGGSNGNFSHTSAAAGVQKGLWSWGTVFADINHDGWEDLLVANGFISGPSTEQDL